MDIAFTDRGRDVYYLGTIPEFFPAPDRSSFAAIHGRKGHNWLGNQKLFDDLALTTTDADLAAYIRSGMGGKVSRPDLTGRDLHALIYYIRLTSLQGKLEPIDPAVIASNLTQAGLFADDTRGPEIRNVTVTQLDAARVKVIWQTDEHTIGLIQYGPTDYYGVSSRIESRYAKDHEVILTNLQQDRRYYLGILSKDQAGNLTHHQASFDVGTPPPILCGDLNKNGKVDIADAVLLAQVIVGSRPTPQPSCLADLNSDGKTNVVDLVLLIKFILGQVAKLSCCGG